MSDAGEPAPDAARSDGAVAHSVSFQLNAEDIVAALRSHWRTVGGWRFAYVCIAVLWIAAIALWLWGGSIIAAMSLTGAAIGAPLYLVAIYWLYLPRHARRQFAQYAALREPVEMSWNARTVTFSSAKFVARTDWSDFRRWAQDDRSYRLYPVDGQYHIVPKRAFTAGDDGADFQACLASIGKPTARS